MPATEDTMSKIDETKTNETAPLSRRAFVGSAAVGAAAVATVLSSTRDGSATLAAAPPAGFVPLAVPGKIVKVTKTGSLQPNGLYPKADDAKAMLEKAMYEFTGTTSLGAAFGKFVHKDDRVAVKVNGIAKGKKFGTNKELVDVILEGLLQAGVPATSIVVYEQFFGHLAGTRVDQNNVPKGVKTMCHTNKDMLSPKVAFADGKTDGRRSKAFADGVKGMLQIGPVGIPPSFRDDLAMAQQHEAVKLILAGSRSIEETADAARGNPFRFRRAAGKSAGSLGYGPEGQA